MISMKLDLNDLLLHQECQGEAKFLELHRNTKMVVQLREMLI